VASGTILFCRNGLPYNRRKLAATSLEPALSFRAHLIAASGVLILAIWLSSGTMTPVASTFYAPIVSTPCHYLYNVDHPLHEAAFRMLDGQPRERWQDSIVLRRILFPLVAYPFMKLAGYEVGGFVASVLCQVAGLLALGGFLRRKYGEGAARIGVWLLATYPGITYWAALPYAYVAIVPASIALFALLTRLDERDDLRATFVTSAAMGVLFTAYDLAPFFGVAALLALLRRRRLRAIPVAVAGLAAAPTISLAILALVFHVGWTNKNTDLYGVIARAYLHPPPLAAWLRSISDFLPALAANYFHGNLVFLPLLFLVVALVARRRPTVPEGALLLASLAVFLFNNLAPPYGGRWQMRGDFIPRLYQPLFVALLVYCARVVAELSRDEQAKPEQTKALFLKVAVVVSCLGNASIAFGPIAHVPWAGHAYHRFYMHSGPDVMDDALERYGRRPLGFCDPGHP
jgi:hypothetical protein